MQTGSAPAGPVETIPDFRITLDGSSWPVATGELPAGTGSVVDFQIQRDLTGGGLPGAARGGSGFSVASGSVTLPMDRAELTPWAAASKRVAPGGLAWLRAHPTTLTSITLGRFIVDECSGASMGGLSVDLVESQRKMDGPFTYPWQYDASNPSQDAVSVLVAAAEQAGFTTTARDFTSGRMGTPASTDVEWKITDASNKPRGLAVLSQTGRFAAHAGNTAVTSGTLAGTLLPGTGSDSDATTTFFGYTMGLTYSGTGIVRQRLTQYSTSGAAGMYADVAVAGTRLTVSVNGTSVWSPTWDGGNLAANEATRVYVRVEHFYNSSAQSRISYVLFRPDGSTSQGDTVLTSGPMPGTYFVAGNPGSPWQTVRFELQMATDAYVRDFVLTDQRPGASTGTGVQPSTSWPVAVSARIELTGSPLKGVFDVAGKSARDVFQAVAAATMGAGWQSEAGDLIYRNATSLRTGKTVEAVTVEEKIEDLPWSISRDNTADRVTVTYTPADVQLDPAHKITLWEATDPIQVSAGRTVTVTAEITGTTDRISPFQKMTNTMDDPVNLRYSRWLAASSRDGGGAQPADDAIRIETKITGPSTVRLSITNTTGSTLWMVDADGNPCVTLRTSLQVQPGEAQVVEWGQTEDKAVQPFDFACDQWVQDASTAQAMLAWLVDQLRSPLPTITQVRIIPDLRRQLGDIVTLTDTESGLKAKALIISMSLEGDKDGYTQRLTLAILSVTYADVRRWARAQGITSRGQLKAHLVAQGATTYAAARAYLARIAVDA